MAELGRNPARIIPRMEMPSVQLPVSGVLDSRLVAGRCLSVHVYLRIRVRDPERTAQQHDQCEDFHRAPNNAPTEIGSFTNNVG